jgi:hypothetical protein
MSSSISSSSPRQGSGRRRQAWLIALMLALAMVLLEAVTRVLLVPTSKDLMRFETHPARARALAAAAPPRIALIGNSTTERGVQPDLLAREWQQRTGRAASVDMFVADGSGVSTWYWMVSHDFWKPGIGPDLFVVSYHGDGLSDAYPLEIGRLARYFTDADDRGALFAEDLTTPDRRVDYLLSTLSRAWAERDRIRERTLLYLPGYRAFVTATNAVNFRREADKPAGSGRSASFRALHRFIERARLEGDRVCFVAFPTRPAAPGAMPYELEAEVLDAIAAGGMRHLDLRRVEGLTAAHYEDRAHLNAAGRQVFTSRLAEALMERCGVAMSQR